ncbi:MAG: ChaN family lipoprotein, partial [Desulfuromonadales bacterium]
HQIPVVGLNATRELVKKVGRNSFESLDEETRSQLPEIDLEDPYQRAMAEAIYADHSSGKAMFDGFLRIQTLWDETMAENIARVMQEKGSEHRMVVMAGGNHVRYGFGIPRRVYRRLPTSYMLVGIRELVVPNKKQGKLMDVKMPRFPMPSYDYLVFTEYESLPGERVKLGVRMKEEDGKVVVEGVVPSSAADQSGLLAGDIIVSMGGVVIADSFDLVYEVSQRVSGDQTALIVEREGEQINLDVTFAPLPKADEHGMGKHKK